MDTSVAASVDDIRGGGGGDEMMVTTVEDDFFIGVDGESGELFFSWTADNEPKTITVGEGDCAFLPSPPSINGDTKTKTQEDLARGRGGSMEQISRPKNTKPQTKVYNFKDLFSPSRLTVDLSHPSNDDGGRVRMDKDMEPPQQNDPQFIQAVPEAQAPDRKKRIRWTDDEHLAPHQRPPPATNSRPRSYGGPTLAQQSLYATLQESNTSRSSSMQRPALVQQSFGVPMQGANTRGFAPTWHQTDAGFHSSSHRQPLPHLGATQRNHLSPTFYPGVAVRMRITQPVVASPEYYHQDRPMLWNNNINLEPPVQNPSSDT